MGKGWGGGGGGGGGGGVFFGQPKGAPSAGRAEIEYDPGLVLLWCRAVANFAWSCAVGLPSTSSGFE